MKFKGLKLLGICLLTLCGCAYEKTSEGHIDNNSTKTNDIVSVGDEKVVNENVVITETVDILEENEVTNNLVIEKSSDEKQTTQTKNNSSKETVKKETKTEENKQEIIETAKEDPMPVPVDPPKEEPKEEPKIEEEIVYGGWHDSSKAKQVFNKINQVRESNGLTSLPWLDSDTWLANTRVEELVDEVATNTVHSGLKKYDRYVGEIAGYGYSTSGVVEAWMNSSGHKNQILADYNTSMAVGTYYDEYTSSYYYIVIFR